MKQLIAIPFVLLVTVPVAAQTELPPFEQELVEVFRVGDRGTFKCESQFDPRIGKYYPTVCVMHYRPDGSGVGTMIGAITSETEIFMLGTDLWGVNKNTLWLLDGKDLVVTAMVRAIGKGEGRTWYIIKMTIFRSEV